MKKLNYVGLTGSLLVIAGALIPMLHIPIIGNWNYYDIDVSLASIVMTLAVLGIIASVLDKRRLLRYTGWGIFFVVLFTLAAVYFKVNDYFSFIPFKKLAAAAIRVVHYRWTGWILLIVGAILVIWSGRKNSEKVIQAKGKSTI